jgi:hypothetical protein
MTSLTCAVRIELSLTPSSIRSGLLVLQEIKKIKDSSVVVKNVYFMFL